MNTTENTPKHCHDCHQLANCRQAQNMMADTPPVEGWVYDGEVYCTDCLGRVIKGTPYEGASDCPTHCGGCGVPIIHELTAEGVEYVREHLDGDGGCCREVWPTVWADYPIMPPISVDSIVIPARFIDGCEGWEGGMNCMIRAITSTGNLTIGTHRPRGCNSDEKWYLTIWRNLSADVSYAERIARESFRNRANDIGHDDWEVLVEFEIWIDEQIDRLERSYGLADWDNSDD